MPGIPDSDTSWPPPGDDDNPGEVGEPESTDFDDSGATIGDGLTDTDFLSDPLIPAPDDFPITENEKAPGEFVASFERTGNHCLRGYKVPFDNYFVHVQKFLGFSRMNGGVLERLLPYADYQHRNQFATRVEIRGVGYRGARLSPTQAPLTSANDYHWAMLLVQFSTLPFPVGTFDPVTGLLQYDPSNTAENLGLAPSDETMRYMYKEVRPGKDYITAKPGGLKFVNPDGTDKADINFPVPQMQSFEDIVVTWYDLPREAMTNLDAAIQKCEGRVNDADVLLPGFPPPATYKAGTLFLQTHSTALRWFPNDAEACDLTYYFKHRDNGPIMDGSTYLEQAGFNYAIRQDGTYFKVARKNTSPVKYLFDTANFSSLFAPG